MPLTQLNQDFLKNKQELTASQLFESLQSAPGGLSSEEATERLKHFGPNKLREAKGKPLILKFVSQFTHLMAIMLWVAGIGAFVAKMPELGIAVWCVNLINGLFSFFQEFRAEKATEALRKILPTYSRVMRDGAEKRVVAEEIVPGDVIFMEEGDSISADCRLLSTADMRVNQSTLTGESRPVNRSSEPVQGEGLSETEMANLVFAGTFVAAGSGKAIVYATGMNTAFGRIATLTQTMHEDLSPLQKEMQSATRIVTALAMGVGFVFLLLARFIAHINWLDSFIFTLGMVVAFVPEGMLPTVTLSLAMGTQRMAKRNALIKKLSAVETLGCTTVICTDKTGTLTQNELTVTAAWLPVLKTDALDGRKIEVTGTGYEPVGKFLEAGRPLQPRDEDALRQLLQTHASCNTARLIPPEDNGHPGSWKILGDPTEASLLVAAGKFGLSADEIHGQILAELPFDSRRKRMSVVHLQRQGNGFLAVAHSKGGIRETLDICTTIRVGDQIVPLTAEMQAQIMQANDNYARNGLRVLAASTRSFEAQPEEYSIETVEQGQTFLGMVAMMDPPRKDVAEAVKKCHRAGIRIIMITGDYGLTGESIARKIGIVSGSNVRIVTGVELEKMSEEDLEEALKEEVLFARVAPEHKLRVVSALQSLGQVVAVTGDGVNDSPALKKADIGVAMGLSGSDVAKEAADMILMDDNFGSIVAAIEEGRTVY